MHTHTSKHTLSRSMFPQGRTPYLPCQTGNMAAMWHHPSTSTVERTLWHLQFFWSYSPYSPTHSHYQDDPLSSQGWGTRLGSAKIISYTVFYSFSDTAPASVYPSTEPVLTASLAGERGRTLKGEKETKLLSVSGKCHYMMKPSCLQTPLH